jgi:zinc transporter ZupT
MIGQSILLFLMGIAGGLPYLLNIEKRRNGIKMILAFSGGYLMAVSLLHLLPEIYEGAGESAGLWILAGFYVQYLLDFFSGGLEHGHVHHHTHGNKMIPWTIFLSLCLHALFEGIPIGIPFQDKETAWSLTLGIVVHNIPISMALTAMLSETGLSKTSLFTFLGIFSLMTPAGMYLAQTPMFNTGEIHQHTGVALAMAFVLGIFLHIATTIVFESAADHKFNLQKIAMIVSGSAAAILIGHLLH